MNAPLKRALTTGVGVFFGSLLIGWFLILFGIFTYWEQLFLLSLPVALLAALFTWVCSHIRALHECINLLRLEIDKLKKP